LEAAQEAWRHIPGAFLAGYFAYDLAAELEDLGSLPVDDTGVPQMFLGLYDAAPSAASVDGAPAALSAGPLRSRPDQAAFEAAVKDTVATIHAGDIFQTNLCRRLEGALPNEAATSLFVRLCEINPARYAAFVRIDEQRAVLSISPESYLRVRDGVVESSPIKGTRPRGRTPEQDEALASDLLASVKDRAELAMIVDVVRNDLGRVCKTGTITVTEHAQLMTLPTVHHSFSTVRGQLQEGATVVDLLRASFPPASISGAPKIEAMRVALREEQQLRGPAMGAIGWISLSGDLELSVAIRTAWVADNKVRYYAGCGITADSIPADEFEESEHKAAAFRRALGA
jgi:para-aminobenzoate synthetase component 1